MHFLYIHAINLFVLFCSLWECVDLCIVALLFPYLLVEFFFFVLECPVLSVLFTLSRYHFYLPSFASTMLYFKYWALENKWKSDRIRISSIVSRNIKLLILTLRNRTWLGEIAGVRKNITRRWSAWLWSRNAKLLGRLEYIRFKRTILYYS